MGYVGVQGCIKKKDEKVGTRIEYAKEIRMERANYWAVMVTTTQRTTEDTELGCRADVREETAGRNGRRQ